VGHLEGPIEDLTLLDGEDHFYYGDHGPDAFPVFRAVLGDADKTRLYVNPTTAAVLGVDAPARASRWIIGGLHDIDFAFLRVGPLREITALLLLAGVTAVAVTGTWLALKRVRLDLRRVRRRLAFGRQQAPTEV
ncbi:MAG TPA: peptidase, partial [Gammaproteobacteria bacterium]|nr:peptidase [Gammaproteobacteria bacterium]